MKETGIVRKLDELGRIVLPVEMRRTLGMELGDPIEILCADGNIVMRKHQDTCVFCNKSGNLIAYKDKLICKSCRDDLLKGE